MKYELLDHDHDELDALLAQFFQTLAAGETKRSYELLDLFWARLAVHIRAEHLHLFPALLRTFDRPGRDGGTPSAPTRDAVRSAIAQLRREHDLFMTEIWAALKRLRDIPGQAGDAAAAGTRQAVREQIESVNRRLQEHNRREESQVYRWADEGMAPAERAELNGKMQAELAHLPPRFQR